jgi:integrase
MPTKLSDTYLRGMAPNTEERDAIAEGLIARRRTGALSFVFQFQFRGRRHKLTLGQYPGVSLADARAKAAKLRGDLQAGRMPDAAENPCRTVADLLDRYAGHLDETAKRPDQAKALLDKHVRPAIGSYALGALTRRAVQNMVDKIRPATVAASAGRYLTAAMNFGEKRGYIEHAIRNLDLPAGRPPKQTYLTDDQLPALLKDWMPQGPDTVGARWPFGPQCLLMLLTGARSSEVSEMRWDEISDERSVVTLSPERSKGGRETVLVLSSFARRVLAALPHFDEDAVFPSVKKREKPGKVDQKPGRSGRGFWCGHARATSDCRARTKIEEWSRHSLRRTCRTGLSRLKVPPHIADAVLNHAPPKLRGVYDKYEFLDERREALELWGAHVFALAGWE